jgi:hypothetical protein
MYYFTMIGITITFRCVWWVQSYFQGHIATIHPDHTMDKYHGFCFNHWVKNNSQKLGTVISCHMGELYDAKSADLSTKADS